MGRKVLQWLQAFTSNVLKQTLDLGNVYEFHFPMTILAYNNIQPSYLSNANTAFEVWLT